MLIYVPETKVVIGMSEQSFMELAIGIERLSFHYNLSQVVREMKSSVVIHFFMNYTLKAKLSLTT